MSDWEDYGGSPPKEECLYTYAQLCSEIDFATRTTDRKWREKLRELARLVASNPTAGNYNLIGLVLDRLCEVGVEP